MVAECREGLSDPYERYFAGGDVAFWGIMSIVRHTLETHHNTPSPTPIPQATNMLYNCMNISKNKVVIFDYTLRDTNNEVIDASGTEPLVYLHGYNSIIPGLEKVLEGKTVGDSFRVTVPSAEAYGEWDPQLVTTTDRSSFNGVKNLAEGMELEARFPDGSQIVKVIKVTETEVTVDGNHPLSGMDLNFEISVRDVHEASEEEIAHGHIHHHHDNCDCCETDGCEGACSCRH